MKTKILLLLMLFAFARSATAQQLVLNPGVAVVTKAGLNFNDPVVRIYDVVDPVARPDFPGRGYNLGIPPYSINNVNWAATKLGLVFGLAINNTSTNPLIYVSNTQIYNGPSASYPQLLGIQRFPLGYIEGAPLIWELNPVVNQQGNALVLSKNTSALFSGNTNAIFNRGTGIGNICYDPTHNLIFATNMEDGRIYRIRASTGEILSRFDPFDIYIDPTPNSTTPSFAPLGERLWGIAYKNDRLYFARWNEDLGNQEGAPNSIHSVLLNPLTGEFMAIGSNGEFRDPAPITEFTLPPIATAKPPTDCNFPYSNPVADIEISDDGQMMLVAERTMSGPIYNFGVPVDNWAHRSRVLGYELIVSGSIRTWVATAPSRNFYVGNMNQVENSYYECTNAGGGVDFSNQEDLVWATGDALKFPGRDGPDPNPDQERVYGLAGIPINGNTPYDGNSSPTPSSVGESSFYQHIFSSNGAAGVTTNVKSQVGDVDILHAFDNTCQTIPLAVDLSSSGNVCEGACTAQIMAAPTTGQAPYTYVWNTDPDNFSSTGLLGPVCAGDYSVTVVDGRGCEYRQTINVGQWPTMTLGVDVLDNASPCGGQSNCSGVAVVNVSGGVPVYNYAFSTTPPSSSISNGILELCAGPYTVTVTDARNCSVTAAFEIGGGPMAVTVETQRAFCSQSCDGTANAVINNGVGPYTYRWSNNPGSLTTSSSVQGLCQGNYTVTVIDNNNCSATAQFIIGTESTLSVLINGGYMLPVCFDMCNASANAVASGGSPPYTFDWFHMPGTNNGSAANGLCEGTYVLKVTDASGCSITTQYVLTERPPMVISATVNQPDCNGTLGAIAISVVGGGVPVFLPYSYQWSNGATTSSISGLVSDAYTVTVRNAYDCTATATFQVAESGAGNISLDLPDSVCVGSELTISVHGTGYVRLNIDGEPGDIEPIPANGRYVFHVSAIDPEAEGIHEICAVVYSAHPDSTDSYCSDTACDIINIKFCGCDSLVGKIDIESESVDGTTYTFTNNGMKATFLTWTINGDTIKSTGNNSITYTVGTGTYIICVQAAFVFVDSNGHSTCCYDYACDTIKRDFCAEWQNTDTVTYTLSPVNFHTATFTFSGNANPVPTVIWNFGDDTDEEVNSGEPIDHNYGAAGTYQACAYVIWSNGSWTPEDFSACCCVDTICIPVTISPCNVNMYRILADSVVGPQTVLQLSPAPPIPIFTVTWTNENGTLIGSGNSVYRTYTPQSSTEVICANIVYMLPPAQAADNGNNPQCSINVCELLTFGEGPQIQGMLRYFPNPTSNLITIEAKAFANEMVYIEIQDNVGRKIKSKTYDNAVEGVNQYYITLDDLASGMYSMKVKVGNTSENVKVIKQ